MRTPGYFLLHAGVMELGFITLLCVILGSIDRLFTNKIIVNSWRVFSVMLLMGISILAQADRALLRWMEQRISVTYLQTYIGAVGDDMSWNMVMTDPFWTILGLIMMGATIIPALATWYLWHKHPGIIQKRWVILWTIVGISLSVSDILSGASVRQMLFTRPVVNTLIKDAYDSFSAQPKHPVQATQDLQSIIRGDFNFERPQPTSPVDDQNYPLWRNDNVGELSVEEFQAQDLSERPDVILFVVETWRGWDTGMLPIEGMTTGNPRTLQFLQGQSAMFPRTHSVGFPSVSGAIGVHLGILPHSRKIFVNSFLNHRTKAMEEILRDFGYKSYLVTGLPPSYSNFEEWFDRWFDTVDYDPDEILGEEQLVDRFIHHYDARDKTQPNLMMIRTMQTHPPYFLPDSMKDQESPDIETRYRQALAYADKQFIRLLEHVKESGDWDRTIIMMVGDHAQGTPLQRRSTAQIGAVNPGHTWTSLAFTGGWHRVLPRGTYDFDISQFNIAPTILTMLNIKAYNHFMGRDLGAMIEEHQREHRDLSKGVHNSVFAEREGHYFWLAGNQRVVFHTVDHDEALYTFDRTDGASYGGLDPDRVQHQKGAPAEWPMERWRDALRMMDALIDQDRLMPPTE